VHKCVCLYMCIYMYTIYQYVDMCINVHVYKCVNRCTQYAKQATLELPHGRMICRKWSDKWSDTSCDKWSDTSCDKWSDTSCDKWSDQSRYGSYDIWSHIYTMKSYMIYRMIYEVIRYGSYDIWSISYLDWSLHLSHDVSLHLSLHFLHIMRLHIIRLCVRVYVHAHKNVSAYKYVYKCLCIWKCTHMYAI